MKQIIDKKYDVVVVGGGLSGVCAAIAASRHAARTALIHNRPVLGGNASSEVRMHICGADHHGTRPDARETGILEEILLENRRLNPNNSFSILDTVLWEKNRYQPGLDLYLNTHMDGVAMDGDRIRSVSAVQLTTEKSFEFRGKLFLDATGDGTLAALSGAEYMRGREGKDVFGEQYAPDRSDEYTMGNSLLFKAVDTGSPAPFVKPFWANTYTEDDLAYRGHREITSGYWWIELGGKDRDIVADGEELRDELLKAVYGVWDHIKNSGHHNADNYALDWVGFLPGKRESRRITGDYILREQDCFGGALFDDAVAYGGWPMDMHVVGGLTTCQEPTLFLHLKEMYAIPYRCLYSKNIVNLMLGGRAISCSHMAFGSTRVMATCAVVGQAGGTAAAMAIEKGITPRDVLSHAGELQQRLLKDDCFIPGLSNTDALDLARQARVTASSAAEDGEAAGVISGVSRRVKDRSNCWISRPLSKDGEWLSLALSEPAPVREVHIKFDSNLSRELMVSLSHSALQKQVPGIPPELVRDYTLVFLKNDEVVRQLAVMDNYQRFRVHRLPEAVDCDTVRIHVSSTHGDASARIFEVRVYR